MSQVKRAIFRGLSRLLVMTTGHGDDRSKRVNDLHHKLSYRLFKLAPPLGFTSHEARKLSSGITIAYNALDGGVGHKFLVYGEYEPFTTRVVAALARPNITAWNIGANLGYYSVLLAKHVERVISFEPHPRNVAMLRKNVELNAVRNVQIVEQALSDTTGEISFFESETNSGDHRVTNEQGRREIKVKSLAVADALSAFPKPDLIVMDVQGAEGIILRSFGDALKDVTLVMEFWPDGLAQTNSSAQEVESLFARLGHNIWKIDEAKKRLVPLKAGSVARGVKPGEEINLLALPASARLPDELASLVNA